MSKNLPNFLIVGAAKCGTSSMHKYLGQHPQIFMSEPKEPRFVSSQVTPFPLNGPKDDRVESRYIKTYDAYVKLFEPADGYPVVGESSADTIYFYDRTIPVIKQYLGDPKILIMLRNPVRRAFSAYQHLVRDLREELSFEDGLKEETNRIRNNWEFIYHYKAASFYYHSVRAFIRNFSAVKVVIFEDQAKKPRQGFRDIFKFLGVDPTFDVNTDIRYNMSGIPKSQWLHHLLFEGNFARTLARPIVRTIFSEEARRRISQRIFEKNLVRTQMNSETKKLLRKAFNNDILNLETLLGRDLSMWRK